VSRVLVVDDAADIRLLIAALLRETGYEVEEAGDGTQALATIAQTPLFDAVVLDIQMPDRDGWSVLRTLRAEARTRDVPVLMCSVKAGAEDLRLAAELGAAYISKPFDVDQFLDAVESCVRVNKPGRANA
jgi:CheY-like chemotaxis protein